MSTNTLDLSDLSSEPIESNVKVEITDLEESEVAEGPDEVSSDEEVEDEAPVEAPVEEVKEVEAPVEAPVEVVAPSTEEVVENVKEILSTEPVVSVDTTELEERVKVLEERFEKLIAFIKTGNGMPEDYV